MSRFPVIDPALLGPMTVLETLDVEAIIATRMVKLKEVWASYDPPAAAQYDVENLEFDPLRIQNEAAAYFELLLRDRVNQGAKNTNLAFGSGTDLDAIASRYPGGVPRMVGESDARYRRRIWLSPNAMSPHGNEEAYVFWALSASDTLRDATAVPVRGTGQIIITVLNEDSDYPRPSEAILNTVRVYINDASRRGLTDVPFVRAPAIKRTAYRVRFWLYPGPDPDVMQASITLSLQTLIEDLRWLNTDHPRAQIIGAATLPGVQNVLLVEPAADIVVTETGVVQVTEIDVKYMGRAE